MLRMIQESKLKVHICSLAFWCDSSVKQTKGYFQTREMSSVILSLERERPATNAIHLNPKTVACTSTAVL